MKSIIDNNQKMTYILAISSILFFVSIFTTPKVLGLFAIQWVVIVFWCIKLMLSAANLTVDDFIEDTCNKAHEAKIENKKLKNKFYLMIIPAMSWGIAMIGVIIFTLLFLM